MSVICFHSSTPVLCKLDIDNIRIIIVFLLYISIIPLVNHFDIITMFGFSRRGRDEN